MNACGGAVLPVVVNMAAGIGIGMRAEGEGGDGRKLENS